MRTPESAVGYLRLLRIPGLGFVFTCVFFARLATQIWTLALVLLALTRFQSPVLAGVLVAALLGPSVVISPLAGALLDRYERRTLIVLDLVVAVTAATTTAVLVATGAITPAALIVLVVAGGVTTAFTNSGTRSLVPALAPADLWDRANAIDAVGNLLPVLGSGIAGALFTVAGPVATIGTVVGLWVAAALAATRLPSPPRAARPQRTVARDVADGLARLLRDAVLRTLTGIGVLFNTGYGIFTVAIPVLLVRQRGASAATVGLVFFLAGFSAAVAGLAFGRVQTAGRERVFIVAGLVAGAAGYAVAAAVSVVPGVAAGAALAGASSGPLFVSLNSLRQRTVELTLFARVVAITMSLHAVGGPAGSLLGGVASERSAPGALLLAAAMLVAAAVASLVALPRGRRPAQG